MKAIISGASGQDASYLIEHLLDKGYEVWGFSRRTASHSTSRIDHLIGNKDFHYTEGDVTDPYFINELIGRVLPDEFYNLAAMSHVHTSFSQPSLTNDINYSGVLNVLNAIKNVSPETKMLNAATSEMFGKSYSVDNYGNKFQDENTPFTPQSPYAISKLAAHHACRLYRESYGLFICSSILGNHESPRRGENFVTRKITLYLGRLTKWLKSRHDNFSFTSEFLVGQEGERFPKLRLGNLDAQRDWGHARAYVQAQHLMLQQSEPDDYVIGTGETRTVREFVKKAFELVGLNYEDFIFIDPEFFRPGEVDYLLMRPAKAKEKLGWSNPITFDELIKEMVEHDQR